MLLEVRVGALLVRGDDELVPLLLEPIGHAELVLDGTEQAGLLLGGLAAVEWQRQRPACCGATLALLFWTYPS